MRHYFPPVSKQRTRSKIAKAQAQRIESITIYQLRIPFHQVFRHALHNREESDAVIVKVTGSDGRSGFGESLPRSYVTGETTETMDIDSIPINFLASIPKTPFEEKHNLTPQRCLKTLCLFRFVNPSKEIRVAGGREINLRSLQPMALYPANSIFVNGYLTTPGQEASDAHQMISDLGFELDSPAAI